MVEVGGCHLPWLWWDVVVVVVVVGDGQEGLRVVGWGCGGCFPTCNMGIICFLNNHISKCPVSPAVCASF